MTSLQLPVDLLRTLLDESTDLVFVVDTTTYRVIDCNEGACRALGYPREELLGLTLGAFDLSFTGERYRELAAAHASAEFDVLTQYRQRDGTVFPVRLKVLARTVEGHPVSLAIARDISSHVAWRQEVEIARRRYEDLVHHLPGIVYRYQLGAGAGVTWVDDRIHDLTGYTADELRGGAVRWLDLVPPDERPTARRTLNGLPGEAFDVVYSLRHRNGGLRLIRDTGHVVAGADGKAAEIEGILFDVTDRMEREQVLREAWMAEHERYELVVQASHQVVHEWVEDHPEVFWGGSIKDVLGYTNEEHGGRFEDWLERIHPDDRERVLGATEDARAKRVRLRQYEYRYRHADGSYRWIWNHMLYEWHDDGRVKRVVGVMQDVTNRKQLEAQVHSAQRMETIGALAGGVAHDVNNYLTTVLGNVDLALMRLDEPWEELLDAREAVQGCAELVRSLLTFARQQQPARVQLDAAEVVTHAVRILTRLVGPGISIRARTEEGLTFEADAVQVQQVLMNLVVNARDAMGGSGSIVIAAERASSGCVRLSVQDTGPGVPLELVERIFEPYFSTRPLGEGTGLGLSIVHGVAKSHGGRVEVANNPNAAGATFSVYFPA